MGPAIDVEKAFDGLARARISLNDVSYSVDGRLGLVVGDSGRLLKDEADGRGWHAVDIVKP